MAVLPALPFVAAALAAILAIVNLLRKRPSPAAWCFFAGMLGLALESLFTGLGLRATTAADVDRWLTRALVVGSIVPAVWLAFSLTYSRGNYREFLARWRVPLVLAALVPVALALGFREDLLAVLPSEVPGQTWWVHSHGAAKVVFIAMVVTAALVLVNLEQTFRSAVGTQRWRIKFVFLGLAVIVGAKLYVRSQAILFSYHDAALTGVLSSALLIGCVFLVIAYARTGLEEIDVYPSSAVLRSSLTMLILGAYLFIVGVMAEVARFLGGVESFQFQALVVLLGMAGLAVLLLSDRLRQRVHHFVVRHFSKAQHDSVRIWTLFSRQLATVRDQASLCGVSAKLVSETFDVLAVNVWLLDEDRARLELNASTTRQVEEGSGGGPVEIPSGAVLQGLRGRISPFDLEGVDEPWAKELRRLNPTQFPNGGNRWCVPLRAGDECVGAFVLADRVSGAVYTVEEQELLRCIGDQVTSVLLGLRLAQDLARARELEAFQAMSAFFVHDLKNTAASLNLMLNNLPVHFDDPDFRADALRSVGNTTRRLEEMIARLSALRQQPELRLVDADLNRIVDEAIDAVGEKPGVELTKDLAPLPPVRADRDQLRSVIANLVLNARDALDGGGHIRIRTDLAGGERAEGLGVARGRRPEVERGSRSEGSDLRVHAMRDGEGGRGQGGEGERPAGRVVLSVEDDGCGMTAEFVRQSLFKPFQSTKRKGLGIGMYQARTIVEKHGGGIQVESEPGKGTRVRVSLPVRGE